MRRVFHPLQSRQLGQLTKDDERRLLENARVLLGVPPAQSGALLLGKNLGVLCGSDELEGLFKGAAEALGARVSHIRPSLSEDSDPGVVRDTARMLARLYDAVECRGVPADLVRRLGAEADVPVYDGISSPAHPTAALAGMLQDQAAATSRRSIVQALLLSTIH
jgi:ornithine carbamoyltransferase